MVCCFGSKRSPPVYNPDNVVVNAELKIGMHCKNCAERVREVIIHLRGVRQCDSDLDTQKVMVVGDFNLDEVVETVKRKLGKRAEVLMSTKKSDVVSEKVISDSNTFWSFLETWEPSRASSEENQKH
ncbi:hypothetical protein Bca4012_021386 [Brassica carinata]